MIVTLIATPIATVDAFTAATMCVLLAGAGMLLMSHGHFPLPHLKPGHSTAHAPAAASISSAPAPEIAEAR